MKIMLSPIKYTYSNPVNIVFKGDFTANEESSAEKIKYLEQNLKNIQMMLRKRPKNNHRRGGDSYLDCLVSDALDQITYASMAFDVKPMKGNSGASMPMGFTVSGLSRLIKDAEDAIEQACQELGMEMPKKDIVNAASKKKAEKPFEKSDKLLTLDEYQQKAVDEFRRGNTVMVTAPTGTGKTLIAEHIIDDILKSGKKVIYTTPLKALCNDKYKQFRALWGRYNERGELIDSPNVGLATGDVKINVNAPIVVMTTEIYRNMLVQQGEKDVEKELKNVDAVIFDEFHYMGDGQRGSTWEESVMFSPKRMKFLMLSATVANAQPLSDWFSEINDDHKSVVVNVPEEERHVPLKHYVYSRVNGALDFQDLTEDTIDIAKLKKGPLSKRQREILAEIKETLGGQNGLDIVENILYNLEGHPQRANARFFIKELVKMEVPYKKAVQSALILADKESKKLSRNADRVEDFNNIQLRQLVLDLHRKNMCPTLYFTYSKKNCKRLMKEISAELGTLLTPEERQEIDVKIRKAQQKGVFLGTDFEKDIRPCLMKGFAMHHAGMLPQCKSLIEELGRNKLIKVCFATDTLGAGINFPFKTVIFSDFEKFSDDGYEEISVNAFKQGAGRAGRRGIDEIGYVVSIPKERESIISHFFKSTLGPDEIQSSFKLTYGLILSPRFLNSSVRVLSNSFDNYQKKSYTAQLQKSIKMLDILKERKIIESVNSKYKLTPKGKIASKARGINEILLAEILTNYEIMENISPEELAGLISIFAPEKEDKDTVPGEICDRKYIEKIDSAIKLAQEIKLLETLKLNGSDIRINSSCIPYIKFWASTPNNSDSREVWSNIINETISKNIIKTEGDFLKKVNYTTNILKQIKKYALSPVIRETAAKAIEMLQKSPVNDILIYELDLKKTDEQS